MVPYKLFIDDERDPVKSDWIVVRSSDHAIKVVAALGMPVEIAFDHDLGGDDTSVRFVNWLINMVLDGDLIFPAEFTYSVHSQNPIGAGTICGKMDALINMSKEMK